MQIRVLRLALLSSVLFVSIGAGVGAGFLQNRFQVPPDFEVQTVYAAEKSGSVIALTFDSRGRLVIAKERGPAVVLIDPEGDGSYEERVVTEALTSCQGLLYDGADMLGVCHGPQGAGLYRAVDTDGDAAAERVETVTLASGRMAEHGPHAVFFGPDGYLYWTLGNHTGIVPTPAPLSPYRNFIEGSLLFDALDPRGHANAIRAPGGVFIRRDLGDPDADWERIAGGFRNQYDGGFDLSGELFTFDSDMEWDLELPWYREVRSVHVVPGGEYGWRTGTRKFAEAYPDNLPPMGEVGRGSPTGVAFYQHYAYPREYRDAFIQGDWSRGRILAGYLRPDGATFGQEAKEFVLGLPLNVTDVEVGPDGAVYFSLGGRDTEGGVYRVVYTGDEPMGAPEPGDAIEEALLLPQPRSAWSRARAAEIARRLGPARFREGLERVASNPTSPVEGRVRALELLRVHAGGADPRLLLQLSNAPTAAVRAAAVYHLGLLSGPEVRHALTERLADEDPVVRRRAAEALVRTGIHEAMEPDRRLVEALLERLGDEDRWVRYSAREALRRINRNAWREAAMGFEGFPAATEGLVALAQTMRGTHDLERLLNRGADLLERQPGPEELIGVVRGVQLILLDDAGVRPAEPTKRIGELLLERFPTGEEVLDREIARTLAYLETQGAHERILAHLRNPALSREQQIALVYTLTGFRGGWTPEAKETVISWFEKVREEEWKGGASYIGYVEGIWNDFLPHLETEERRLAMERVPSLSPSPEGGAAQGPAFRRAGYAEAMTNQEIEEYLIYDPMSYKGDPSAGAEAYVKAFCASCHRFGPMGQEFGPDLTTVGRRFERADIVEAILYPSRTISDLWASEEITRTDGTVIVGNVYREDSEAIGVAIPAGPRVTIPRSEIASRVRSTTSPMPEGLLNNLTAEEMRSLLLFLEAGPEAVPDSLR